VINFRRKSTSSHRRRKHFAPADAGVSNHGKHRMREIHLGSLFHESQDFADLRRGQVEALPDFRCLGVVKITLLEHFLDLFQCPERWAVAVGLDNWQGGGGRRVNNFLLNGPSEDTDESLPLFLDRCVGHLSQTPMKDRHQILCRNWSTGTLANFPSTSLAVSRWIRSVIIVDSALNPVCASRYLPLASQRSGRPDEGSIWLSLLAPHNKIAGSTPTGTFHFVSV